MIQNDFTRELILENDRVLLRPLLAEDIEHLRVFSENEPELWTYSLQPASGIENLKTYVQAALEGRKSGNIYPFIVFDKRTNSYAGSTRFYDFQAQHKTTLLGYTWFGKAYQGTGLNKNCKFLMLEYAFENLNLERVEFRADAKNEQSIAAMKSIGCKEEGILRNNCASLTGRRDSIVMSILKSEWLDSVKDHLLRKLEL